MHESEQSQIVTSWWLVTLVAEAFVVHSVDGADIKARDLYGETPQHFKFGGCWVAGVEDGATCGVFSYGRVCLLTQY